MKVIVFEEEAFYQLIDEVTKRVSKKVQPVVTQKNNEWINSTEAKKLLGIKSNGKLNQLVKDKHITASKHGRTLVYCRQSILNFLEQSKIL